MKLTKARIHNYRSIIDGELRGHDYMLLVGANNAGKSTVLNALRAFYDEKWSSHDFPKIGAKDAESWVQLQFELTDDEWDGLADEYKSATGGKFLTVRRYFKSNEKDRVKANQSNIYGVVDGKILDNLFYGAKNVSSAKVGEVLYVPALSTPAENTKMSGPSPLRNMLNFLLKKVVAKSPAFAKITDAFEELNIEANQKNGFLNEVSRPLNSAIEPWKIKIDLSVNPVAPEDITKSLVKFAFLDTTLGNAAFDLDKYGHGFQRSVIYELIRLAPTFREEKKPKEKEFNPDFHLVLFEEPEAFLHPSQQECMAFHLRRLSSELGQQVIVTSHSPIFAGKAGESIGQIARVDRSNGTTQIYQPSKDQVDQVFQRGGELLAALTAFEADPAIADNKKARARRMIADPPQADIAVQEERFRFQLWLDGERSSMFFADKVLLVEGASERALFNYLLANDWHDLSTHKICVIDVLGKFNFHRYLALLDVFGIPHGVMLDDDNNAGPHVEFYGAVNDLVENSSNAFSLAPPVKFQNCLEAFLGLPVPRDDKKPIEIMKALTSNAIAEDRLTELRTNFCASLAIQ
ncbi:ATP-dependent nuclease [Nitrosococcus wardiae]|uniref:ATP-dependent endonuclease n=1 Tax=Nitrosococcus wardiae TaxID=1814290 RepID=A0A4P7C087_9GAMM|nr:AAA family ATPase [Nitrosococcus wardiae]QBQ55831.1 ATP-dependent endonuclease [Nitrosococcus wardiae]